MAIRTIVHFLLVLVLSLPLLRCSAELRDRTIGVNVPLTGPIASIGGAIRNGIELARVDHPRRFDGIKFVYEDNQDEPKLALGAFRKLRDFDRVDVHFLATNAGEAVAPLADRTATPLILFGFQAKPALGRPSIVRTMNYSAQYARVLLESLRSRGVRNFKIIKTELSFFDSMIDGMKNSLEPEERLDILASVIPGEMDFRSVLARLKDDEVESIGLFLLPHQIDAFCKQAAESRLKFFLYGTDLFETAARLHAHPMLAGAIYPDNNVQAQFLERYRSVYGNDEQVTFAANSYDIALIVADALRSAEQFNSKEFVDALVKTPAGTGMLGSYSFRDSAEGGQFFEYRVGVKEIALAE